MRMILATAILGLSFETVHAQTVDRIDITEYGIYTTDTAAFAWHESALPDPAASCGPRLVLRPDIATGRLIRRAEA
jgi:hypothetical protein